MKNQNVSSFKMKLLLAGLLAAWTAPAVVAQDFTHTFASYTVGNSGSEDPLGPYEGQHAVLGRSAANGGDDLILVIDKTTQKIYGYSIADLAGDDLFF